MLEKLTHEAFTERIGEQMEFELADIHFSAITDEVTTMPQQPGQQRVPFSVIFQALGDDNHGQHLYQARHPQMGEFPIFLVPIGPGEKGMRYEAVFN